MWWNMRITQTLTYGLAIFSNISYNHDLTNVCSVFRCLNMWDLAPYKSNPIVGGKTKTLFMSSHVPRNVKCSCRWYFNSFILYNFDVKYSMLNHMKIQIWQAKITFPYLKSTIRNIQILFYFQSNLQSMIHISCHVMLRE